MRLFELDKTTDDPTVEEIANAIASDCVPFLKAAGGQMLLRGLEWQHGKEMINDSLYHFAFRTDRGPKKALPEFFYYIDNAMKQAGLKATRSNSDLFTGDYNTASLYSDPTVFVCFPIGDFDYTYNPNVHDYLDDMLDQGREIYKPYLHDEPEVAAELWWEKIGDGYKSTDLSTALQSNVEIMVTGNKGYYAMPVDVAEDVYKVLNEEMETWWKIG